MAEYSRRPPYCFPIENQNVENKRSTFYFTENQDLKKRYRKFQKFPPPYLRMVRRHKREKGK
jgi:hypothetical protein